METAIQSLKNSPEELVESVGRGVVVGVSIVPVGAGTVPVGDGMRMELE